MSPVTGLILVIDVSTRASNRFYANTQTISKQNEIVDIPSRMSFLSSSVAGWVEWTQINKPRGGNKNVNPINYNAVHSSKK